MAKQYFEDGDFEKAVVFYEKLTKKSPRRTDYLQGLVACYQQLERYEDANRFLNEQLKGKSPHPTLLIELGYNYTLQDSTAQANVYFDQALNVITQNPNYGYALGYQFQKYSLLDRALSSYQKAMEINPELDYNFQLARIYGEQGNVDKMYRSYLNLLSNGKTSKSNILRSIDAFISSDPEDQNNLTLKTILLENVQKNPDVIWNELLSWLFVQQEQYGSAFRQEKAIYKRMEDGNTLRLENLGKLALDENENSVKRMHSFTSVMPGEVLGCVGCHEDRSSTPRNTRGRPMLAALKRPASQIESIEGIPDVYDYPKDIQPLLDKHCVSCHEPSNRSGGVILTGDHGPMFSLSYFNLTINKQIADGRNRNKSNYPPYSIGASASPLLDKIQGDHHHVKFNKEEIRLVRYWIESGAPYPGTYAALGGGAIGGYYQNTQLVNNDTYWPETRKASQVIKKQCFSCHKEILRIPQTLTDENEVSFWRPDWNDPRLHRVRHVVFNLSDPEHSLMLMAPLSPAEGGYGSCREIRKNGSYGDPVEVFKSKNDRSYLAILAMIQAGKSRLEEVTRFDMPDFKPHPAYFREMKRYGILPADFDEEIDQYDVYELDRSYWDSFIYRP